MAQFPFRDFLRDTDDGKKALTTANHVMTEGGVWIPQRGSDDGAVHTQVTGSNVVKVDTLVNAETVDGEGNLRTEITATNESYIMLLTTVDNTDWSMRVRDVAGSLFYGRTYPDTENVEVASTINNPFYAMILGYRNLQDSSNRVSSWTEAKELALPPNYLNSVASANLQFDNHNSEEATVTIRLLRVWE